jgi:hypothetical protein
MSTLAPFDAYFTLSSTEAFIPLDITPSAVLEIETAASTPVRTYNIMGQQVNAHHKGIVIINGRKYVTN